METTSDGTAQDDFWFSKERGREGPVLAKGSSNSALGHGTKPSPGCEVVVSGSFRREPSELATEYEDLIKLGCHVLSPSNVEIVGEERGFVFMEGEQGSSPAHIQDRHLNSIQNSEFVWLHAPDGYVGTSGAMEIGFAFANGVPVYCKSELRERVLQFYTRKVEGPAEALADAESNPVRAHPALRTLQRYYRRAAVRRGHDHEDARTCLQLLWGEVEELDEAVCRFVNQSQDSEARRHLSGELADVFLYLVHMANILQIDLADAVRDKELVNEHRFTE